jgi:site-specific recombinase XerD
LEYPFDAIMPSEALSNSHRVLQISKWQVLKGLHLLRHSFIFVPANKSVDQRIITDLVGHPNEPQ